MIAAERTPSEKGDTTEGEKGVSVLALSGRYKEDFTGMPSIPFGGFLYRQDATSRVVGRIIDPHGSADVMGRMTQGRLFLIKFYDPQILTVEDNYDHPTTIAQETYLSRVPIFYRLAMNESGDWEGRYRIQGSSSGKVQCGIGDLHIPAPLFTFVHDDPYSRSRYDEVFFSIRERLVTREEEIFKYHPEKRGPHGRGRIDPKVPMLQF